MSVEVDIAEIKRDISHINGQIGANIKDFKEHMRTSESYREKVNSLEGMKKELESHTVVDRWMFGILITMNLAILVKIFT